MATGRSMKGVDMPIQILRDQVTTNTETLLERNWFSPRRLVPVPSGLIPGRDRGLLRALIFEPADIVHALRQSARQRVTPSAGLEFGGLLIQLNIGHGEELQGAGSLVWRTPAR